MGHSAMGNTKMENTEPVSWERVVPDRLDQKITFQRQILAQHLERYNFAAKFVRNKRVLDAACGSGYGSRILADSGALAVVGLDLDSPTIEYASQRYGGDSIRFCRADLNNDDLANYNFDVCVSFETVEHLDNPREFLTRIHSHLPSDGMLIASVPTAPLVDLDEFHQHDFTSDSWRYLVQSAGYKIIEELPQRYCASMKELKQESLATNTKAGARSNQFQYYLMHPLSFIRRFFRLAVYGLEFEMLTVAARKVF